MNALRENQTGRQDDRRDFLAVDAVIPDLKAGSVKQVYQLLAQQAARDTGLP